MTEMLTQEDFATRCHKVRQFAFNLYQRGPDWVTFFREVLGVSGAARKVFANQDEYVNFEKTDEYTAIQQMVNGLRTRKRGWRLPARTDSRHHCPSAGKLARSTQAGSDGSQH